MLDGSGEEGVQQQQSTSSPSTLTVPTIRHSQMVDTTIASPATRMRFRYPSGITKASIQSATPSAAMQPSSRTQTGANLSREIIAIVVASVVRAKPHACHLAVATYRPGGCCRRDQKRRLQSTFMVGGVLRLSTRTLQRSSTSAPDADKTPPPHR